MLSKSNDHYNALSVLSYNGIINEVITNRNYGKTWAFKRRAWRRAVKRGKKTIWLRTFKKEAKEASATFYASIDLQKFCGIVPWDADKKTGNFLQRGNTFYYRRGNTWVWFLKVCALSDTNALRSADDVNTDTIVYDEFTTTADKLKRYKGNVVNDFIDLFFSIKREHTVRCFLLGNKENVLNPFLTYFNVKPLPSTFEGIRVYRGGALVVQQLNNKPNEIGDYNKKVRALLDGTAYGRYIYEDAYKGEQKIKRARPPKSANEYIQLDIEGYTLRIWIDGGTFYVTNKIDTTRRVFTLTVYNKYKREYLLVRRQKSYFTALVNALADSRICYDTIETYEAIQPFYRWLSV